jgi:hypothetical protein
MDRFRNINYPYANQDDTFQARGLHLNMIVDEINNLHSGVPVDDITNTEVRDIVLGLSKDIDAAFIDYKYTIPTSPGIFNNWDQSGRLQANNSSEHANSPALSWTQESTNHAPGAESIVLTFEFVVVEGNLILRVTNHATYTVQFTYTLKILKYAS